MLRFMGRKESDTTEGLISDGFPSGSDGKESACQCRRCRFDPWMGKILWQGKWQPIPIFLPGKSHRQRSLAGYNPWGRRLRHDRGTNNNMKMSQDQEG